MAFPSPQNDGWRLKIFTGLFIPLQIVAVALRYYSRWLLIDIRFSLDDQLILIALILQIILSAVAVGSVPYSGIAYKMEDLKQHDPTKLASWGKYQQAIIVLYYINVNIPKFAILGLYQRVFPTRRVRIAVYSIGAVLLSATIANVATSIAACRPFKATYDPTVQPRNCIDRRFFYIWTSIPNIASDIVMLILPLPIIWGLQKTSRVKIGLTFTFLVGILGLIISILRFRTFILTNAFVDGTQNAVELIIWTVMEPGIYLISACLLTFRPLLERLSKIRPKAVFMRDDNLSLTSLGPNRTPHVASQNEAYRKVAVGSTNRDSVILEVVNEREASTTLGIVGGSPRNDPSHAKADAATTGTRNYGRRH